MKFPLLLFSSSLFHSPYTTLSSALLLSISVLSSSSSPHTLSLTSSTLSTYLIFLSSLLLVLVLSLPSAPPKPLSFLTLILLFLFLFTSSFHFFLLFEASTLPLVLLVLSWGPQPERLSSTLFLFFYTLSSSLPTLFLTLTNPSPHFWDLPSYPLPLHLLLSLPFLVKTPIYLLHLWLPKAHVEAPVYGSMVLAGILLKMGAYGIWKFLTPTTPTAIQTLAPLSFVGSTLAALVTILQEDLKALIAYSSVVHMGLSTYVVFSPTPSSLHPLVMLLLSHGIASSGLFLISYLGYSSSSSRSLLLSSVPLWSTPPLTLAFVLVLLMNLGVPPSLNFFSEYLLLITLLSSSWLWSSFVLVVMSGVIIYSVVLFTSCSHGSSTQSHSIYNPSTLCGFTSSMLHTSWWFLGPLSLFLFE